MIVEGDDLYGDGVNIAARGAGGVAAAGSSGTARKVRPDPKFADSLIVYRRPCAVGLQPTDFSSAGTHDLRQAIIEVGPGS